MRDTILKHLLKNAYEFKGKVNTNAILGLVLRENPDLKKDVPKVIKEIEKQAKEITKLDLSEIKDKLNKNFPEMLKEKKEKKHEGPLKPLQNAKVGKVSVRIAPSPSGPLHIGHAYGASLNYEYAKMYKGKFHVRIEDTNPENIYEPAYKLIENDANWLAENNVDKITIQSTRLGNYYDYAEKLVQKGKAYVCTCNPDTWRKMKSQGEACPCRSLGKKENQTRFSKMFNEYAEGEAVLRLKTDIKDKNPAMRDFGIMRINEHIHPKTGKEQRVWPLMVFSVAIDDYELGITHVLNGKDHADNAKKEALILKDLGLKPPQYQHWGRINFTGFKISASKTKLAIEQGEYTGWDDIKLPFLPALRRRGYQPEAFRKFASKIGLSLNDKTVSLEEFWKMVNAFNKEIVEPKSNRYFFVSDPHKINIRGMQEKTIEIDSHPDFPKKGKRKLRVKNNFFVDEKDFKDLGERRTHRLMDCCNFKVDGSSFKYLSDNYEEYKNSKDKGRIIHWLPAENTVDVEVMLSNGDIITGYGEESMKKIKEDDVIQLERMFFARCDKKDKNKIKFWYLHR